MRGPTRKIAALAVHVLTASGGLWGVLALDAIAAQRFGAALGWMALAVAVDSIDGAAARLLRVSETMPEIDGSLLDNMVDYLNYAVVPAALMLGSGVLPSSLALGAVAAVVLAAALQMSHRSAKTEDHLFRGFPSYWNVVAAYLLLLELDPWINAAIVFGFAALSFAPVYFPYASRTARLRSATLVLGALWGACMIVLALSWPDADARLARVSLLYPAWHVALAAWLTRERARGRANATAG